MPKIISPQVLVQGFNHTIYYAITVRRPAGGEASLEPRCLLRVNTPSLHLNFTGALRGEDKTPTFIICSQVWLKKKKKKKKDTSDITSQRTTCQRRDDAHRRQKLCTHCAVHFSRVEFKHLLQNKVINVTSPLNCLKPQ